MNILSDLLIYLNTLYLPYHGFTQNIFGLCIHFTLMFLIFVYLGRLLKKFGKSSVVIFIIIGAIYILLLPKIEITATLRTLILASYVWGIDYQGESLQKNLIIVPIALAVIQFSLVSFVYTPVLEFLGSSTDTLDMRVWTFSMLTFIGVSVGYLIVHKYLKSKSWLSDLLLAFVLFFYFPLPLFN